MAWIRAQKSLDVKIASYCRSLITNISMINGLKHRVAYLQIESTSSVHKADNPQTVVRGLQSAYLGGNNGRVPPI